MAFFLKQGPFGEPVLTVSLSKSNSIRPASPSPPPIRRSPTDRDHFWSSEFQDTAAGVLSVDPAASEEPHARVHTDATTDNRFYLSGPTESGRIDDTLDTTGHCSGEVQLDAVEFAVFGSSNSEGQLRAGPTAGLQIHSI